MKQFFALLLVLFSLNAYAQDFTANINIDYSNGGLIVADFNNDSFPDVIFQQRIPFGGGVKRLVVEVNNTTDSLSFTKTEFVVENELFGGGAAGDFNADGLLDLVFSATEEASLILFAQNADGTLAESVLPTIGAVTLRAADLNGDEFIDLIGLNIADREIVAYINNNGTGFTRSTLYGNSLTISDFLVVDIDMDGDMDVLFGTDTFNGEAFGMLRNDGTATFTLELIESTSSVIDGVEGISTGDMNLDGRIDIALTPSFNVYLYFQAESGSFTRTEVPTASSLIRSILIGDFNGDGAGDFMTGDNSNEGIRLYTSDGTENPAFTSNLIVGIRPVFSMQGQDMNRDGDLDVVVSNGEFHTLENTIEQLPPVSIFTPELNEVVVYPNPVSEDYLSLTNVPFRSNADFELLDMNGKTVRRGPVGAGQRIDMRGIPRGTYVVRLFEGEQIWGSTLVVKQ
jgi:hypothetical protein